MIVDVAATTGVVGGTTAGVDVATTDGGVVFAVGTFGSAIGTGATIGAGSEAGTKTR